jgi:16S rRNA G966 N2-methylase RsmD
MPSSQALRLLEKRGIEADYIFLDPPYDKEGSGSGLYAGILEEIEKYGRFSAKASVIIQHYHRNSLPDNMASFRKIRVRGYGSTTLTFYNNVTD